MSEEYASWQQMINEILEVGEEIIACTQSEQEMNRQFDCSYGLEKGKPFTAWSETNVFFPVCYDGSEWVAKVPRHPNGEHTNHVGG